MNAEVISETDFRITKEAVQASSTNIIPAGNVVIATRVGLGKVCLLSGDTAINQDLRGIIPKQPGSLLPRYLFYCFKTIAPHIISAGTGATVQGVKGNFVKSLRFPLPSLPEQQRIVAILDEAFAGIATAVANTEKNLANARELFESYLNAVFTQKGEGWVERPLGTVCDLLNGFAFKSKDVVLESKTQLVRMGNLYGNRLDLDRSPVFYPDRFTVEYRRYLLKEGDLIMSLTGTTGKEDYGYAVRIPKCDQALLMNQRIAKFDSIKEDIVNRDYLLHYLRSRIFLNVLYSTANGTRQANLSSVTIKTLPIPLCPIREQKTIASSLKSLSEKTHLLESLYQHKRTTLADLKQSLLHKAFSGALTSQSVSVLQEAVA